jgi:hypothetical protein
MTERVRRDLAGAVGRSSAVTVDENHEERQRLEKPSVYLQKIEESNNKEDEPARLEAEAEADTEAEEEDEEELLEAEAETYEDHLEVM